MNRFACLLTLLFVGCVKTVGVSEPVGEKAPEGTLRAAVGEWRVPRERELKLVLRLSEDGEFVAESLVWDEKKSEYVSEGDQLLDIRQCGPNLFLMADVGNRMEVMLIAQPNPDRVEVFSAEAMAFRRAIESGAVNGRIIDKDRSSFEARLDADEQLEALLAKNDVKQLFSKEPWFLLERVKKPQKAEPGVGADSR